MSSAPSVPGVEVGAPWPGGCEHVLTAGALKMVAALDGTFGPGRAKFFMADREGEPMPVARIVQVPGASVQGVPVGRHLADALDGSRQAGLAQHPDGRFGPLALFTKEYVHARRSPAGL